MARGGELMLMEKIGRVSQLRFHPRFTLKVNGMKVGTYVADSSYVRDGKQFVEDVKPIRFMTDLARHKIALFNAIHAPLGLAVTIIER